MLSPNYAGLLRVLYDWQTIITGGLAILAALIGGGMTYRAGVIQAKATRKAANEQIAAAARKDRLQARGIAVAIYSDILELKIIIEKSRTRIIEITRSFSGELPGQNISALVQEVGSIEMPRMLNSNIDLLFMLSEPAGPACLQLVSLLFQYDALVKDITSRIVTRNADEWAEKDIRHLEEHLTSLEEVVTKCKNEVQAITTGAGE
jgi:hypothetical protein